METEEIAAEKCTASEYLDFNAKTARRVSWEAWEFTAIGSNQIKVTNASYGFKKYDHTYVVTVETRWGLAIPVACDCPADQYSDEYDCKHKVALATIGGPTMLNAAIAFNDCSPNPPNRGEKCECTPSFPCADCYISGERGFTE